MTPAKLLSSGLRELDLDSATDLPARLFAFTDDLMKWNKVYNLTAIRRLEDIVVQHLLDSLSILPHLRDSALIDVGAGGGFPSIPIALANPDQEIWMLDSNTKKTRFLQQMVINHNLENCQVVHCRAEDQEGVFGQVVCRAFASLNDIVRFAGHLVAPDGQLLAMKAQPEEEIAALEKSGSRFKVQNILPIHVPHLNAERCLVVLHAGEPSEASI